ncbi:hypothetical protein [Nocardia sp. NRRL S-836]|uniref:hypothetical protein n=1 Tax=Nocardia sp. NRRL S-836 TaxID=1519492 RepID=UPI0006B04DA8|nr:hypothetical protein [Nocardia sp. NRRL S-836]KOV85315.1 hypothetical protein ADL03_14280 [Nocardia sp. NRRL S-836]
MTTRTEPTQERADEPGSREGTAPGGQQPVDKPTRLNVNISTATEEALALLVEQEGVTITEAVRRLIGYGMVLYKADKIDKADVLIRREGQTERVIIL